MTRLRRQRRSLRTGVLWLALAAATAATTWPSGHAASAEPVAADRQTGLAIQGYDPVAYFNADAARPGREDVALKRGGVTWRFDSEGNRDAFASDPQAYMPEYGGHDPVAITRNDAHPGRPDLWTIHNDRLFLFASPDSRKAFLADPDFVALQAEVNWPHVSETADQ